MMVIALAMFGCGGSHTLDDDAGEPEGIDAATDAHEPVPDVHVDDEDAGVDAWVESLDTAADAPGVVRHVECTYFHGAECRVECTDAPDVPIELFIEWSEPYCCEDIHFGSDDSHWSNCRCVAGLVRCGGAIPQTWCDLCGLPGGGHGPDAYAFDAGP